MPVPRITPPTSSSVGGLMYCSSFPASNVHTAGIATMSVKASDTSAEVQPCVSIMGMTSTLHA